MPASVHRASFGQAPGESGSIMTAAHHSASTNLRVKLQYLGDSKDSFKWDYHDYLASELDYPWLNVAPMLTPDDGGNDGKTKAEWFPGRTPVLRFCRELQSSRTIERIKTL